ncbi:MAG TPA: mechanosensitive ion channel family protein [Flavobacterium sp.]
MFIQKNSRSTFYFIFVGLFILFSSYDAVAQLMPEPTQETQEPIVPEVPPDSLQRRTPRGTVSGFIQAVADQNLIRASRYLNLSRARQKNKERERIVKVFQKLLDQGGNIMPYSWISNQGSGRTDDELPPGVDLAGTITVGEENINLLVENTGTDDVPLWQFSSGTVDTLLDVTLNEVVLIDKLLPDVMEEKLFAGVPVGHWIAVLLLIGISYLIAWSIIALVHYLIRLVWAKAKTEPTSGVLEALELPFRLYLSVWLYVVLSQQVGISIVVRQRFSGITIIIGLVALAILLWRLTDFISNFSKKKMTLRGRLSALSVILFLRRAAKFAIVVFAAIAILGTLGFDVTTGLAALGIGGIALALGAQKTVENFVGSVTLIADQPVRVGDFCKVGDVSGTVEQIGMRSTQIRTGERTVVTIPNGQFASEKIENFAPRERHLFAPVLKLRYETTPDQIRYLLVEIRTILYAHPMINPDPARIRFAGFGDTFLKLEVWAYIETANYDVFLEVQEDLYLRIMDVVKSSGTDFAFPSQTLYMARDRGVSDEKVAEVSEKVKEWIDKEEVQLPNFDPERIAALKGTIQYPSAGSIKNKNG